MAPVALAATLLLALSTAAPVADAAPSLPSSPRLARFLRRFYYGDSEGLARPAALVDRRSTLPDGWTYEGCVTESSGQRLLQGFAFSSSSNSPTLCLTECAKRGYTIAGTEYGDECYCATDLEGSGGVTVSDSYCSSSCAGSSGEKCGAAWYLSLYTYNSTLGGVLCSAGGSSSTGTASPSATSTTTESTSSTSVPSSTSPTATSEPTVSASSGLPTTSSDFLTTSSGLLTTSTVEPTSTEPTSTAPTSTERTSTASPSATGSSWTLIGCALDSGSRLMNAASEQKVTNMTPTLCQSFCGDKGYPYAATENGEECWCSSTLPATVDWTSASCNDPCTGDSSETCGGQWALQVYSKGSTSGATTGSAASTSGSNTATTSVESQSTGIAETAISTTLAPTSAASSQSTSEGVSSGSPSLSTTDGVSSTSAGISSTSQGVTSTSDGLTTTSTVMPTSTSVSEPATTTSTVAPSTTSVPASSASHYVWAHHMVGYTYSYSSSDWTEDVTNAKAYGIDGFALNMGSDSWQPDRISTAYAVAESAGSFKMFLSFDMTSMSCSSASDATTLVNLVKAYASSSAQATVNGAVLVSTFSGESCTFGTGSLNGWQTAFIDVLSAGGITVEFVPAVFSSTSSFSSYTWMDGEFNWNSAWPMGDYDIGTASTDAAYVAALGTKSYMPAVSPFFFTHFGANSYNKNWLYRSDDWLYCTRWEEIIAMRATSTMTEILTWNDFGESSYIGPIHGSLPGDSAQWVDGFAHTGLATLTNYYATAFKTGSYPTMATDSIVLWSRPHPATATASADSVGRPTNYAWTDDYLYAVVLATEAATVTLTAGTNTETVAVAKGLNKIKVASSAGSISATIARSGSTVVSYSSGSDFVYTTTPVTYNYNYFVASASG
ncbi:uncharacterized protein EHS24_001910 [Apiotrichum porosum]|uniref:WSC domain-containing protein n=1 Tax=Apiotrichum porosum TaxID=105984 RepID=A0A427XJP8_9TREE|nr:uncharacterized protein EHS24_001910 [Apiotrichum porosum]RSH78984.1 hypothetical protein EHS24_001910 [Apiotrichum porosum]